MKSGLVCKTVPGFHLILLSIICYFARLDSSFAWVSIASVNVLLSVNVRLNFCFCIGSGYCILFNAE